MQSSLHFSRRKSVKPRSATQLTHSYGRAESPIRHAQTSRPGELGKWQTINLSECVQPEGNASLDKKKHLSTSTHTATPASQTPMIDQWQPPGRATSSHLWLRGASSTKASPSASTVPHFRMKGGRTFAHELLHALGGPSWQGCPDRRFPVSTVKRAARSYKSAIRKGFTMGNAQGA